MKYGMICNNVYLLVKRTQGNLHCFLFQFSKMNLSYFIFFFFLKDSKEKATYPWARKKRSHVDLSPTREPAPLHKYPRWPQLLYHKLESAQSSSTSCLFNNVLIHVERVNTHCHPTTLSGGGGLRV